MDKSKFSLDEIISNDPLGILDYRRRDTPRTGNQRLLDSFLLVNDFFQDNKREPEKSTDTTERGLWAVLKGIRENLDKVSALKEYDKYDLLGGTEEKVTINSIDDVFDNDPLGILGDSDVDIFTLKNVPEVSKERAEAEFVSRRKKCEDFEMYEGIFKQTQTDLKDGKKEVRKFEHGDLKIKGIYVDKGVLVLIESMEMEDEKDSFGKEDGRLLCIFENGTQSNIKFRTLQKSLEIDGRTVIEKHQTPLSSKDDIETGYIYILKSLSNDDRILTMKNLYKIGFSSGEVKDRIKNAEKDPTYLMAPVAIVSSFKVINMNPHRLEQLLHRFFGSSRLGIDIVGPEGIVHTPREWFIASLGIIEKAIEMIVDGSIVDYQYDGERESIIKL